MRITKYPQSCLVVEVPGTGRVVIDPGGPARDSVTLEELLPVSAVLVTHRHPDHLDRGWIGDLLDRGIEVVTNADVAGLLERDDLRIVAGGEQVEVAGIDVQVFDIPHMPMVDGSAGPPNLGYLLDGRLLHPGDGVDLASLRAEVLAVPIAGPSCSARDAYVMIEAVGASAAVPIHYDTWPEDPRVFADHAGGVADIRVLAPGESTTF